MSFSEFTTHDYELINAAYDSLKEVARPRCQNEEEFAVVEKAFAFANEAHKNVRRRSGEPYMLHPIEVAKIVITEIGLGFKSISAALLHDVVEDTDYTVEDIKNLFGDKIAQLVDGMTKIKTVLDNEDRSNTRFKYSESLQAENFKRILLTLGDDARVVLIKLADRLHNCRTIEFMPEHKRDKILSETMFIFIPLAHRLGLYGVKSEMENIWLRYKEPSDFKEISDRISMDVSVRDKEIDDFIAPINDALTAAGFKFTVKKRIKTPYSIWYKMKTKKVPFEQIYDLYAVRIIFDSKQPMTDAERNEAYIIYATVTKLYKDNPSRLRDWIKQPKNNGYEALHCTLMSHSGFWVEVQIRSRRMDDIAEKGIAAHWTYKQGGYTSEFENEMDRWLIKVQDILKSNDVNALELLDLIHNDLVSNEIVVFTPKGEQRSIPNGSTVLDFAYQIHTHIGHQAIAAKVNMKLVPLSQVLKSGDQIEIITAQNAKPNVDWLTFLQTRHARRLLMDYIRDNMPENLQAANDYLSVQRQKALDSIKADRILLSEGQRFEIASCCNPIPGDPVIGYKRQDGVIVVHKKTCRTAESLASTHGNRLVVPQWPNEMIELPVRISIKCIDRVGLLSDIANVISKDMGINMRKLHIECNSGIVSGEIELMVRSRGTVDNIVNAIKTLDGIQDVVRTDL